MNATNERQAWCCLQVKLCDPCLSALCVPWCKKALYKHSSFPFLLLYNPVDTVKWESEAQTTSYGEVRENIGVAVTGH